MADTSAPPPRIASLIGWFLGAIGSVMALASIATLIVVRPAAGARVEGALPGSPAPTGPPAFLYDILLGHLHEAAIVTAALGVITLVVSFFFLRLARWAYRGVAILAWVHLLLIALVLASFVASGISMIALLGGGASSTPIFIGVMLIIGGLTLGLIYGLPVVIVIRRLREPALRAAFRDR